MGESAYKKLIVWQKSMNLVDLIYQQTEKFRFIDRRLCDQMRSSAVSIPSNIAEGRYRLSIKEGRSFYRIASASAAELETQLIIAHRQSYFETENFAKCSMIIDEILRMLNGMIQRTSTKI